MNAITETARWRRFSGLILGLFFCRGLFVLALLPPFEGWDEYQHLAYLVHLDETGERPHAGRDSVSPRLLSKLKDYPQPYYGVEQLEGTGVRTYQGFWNGANAEVQEPLPDVLLYQGQHASLSYWLMLPVYRAAGGLADLKVTMACLRLFNLLLATASVAMVLGAFRALIRRSDLLYTCSILAAANPLMLMNSCRVANDALAFFLGTAGLCFFLQTTDSRQWKSLLILGLLLGVSVVAKSTNLPLAGGVFLAYFLREALAGRWRRALGRSALLLVFFLLPQLPDLIGNMQDYGSPLSDKRSVAVVGASTRPTIADYKEGLLKLPWLGSFRERILRLSLFTGGWSYVRLPKLFHECHVWLILAASFATVLGLLRGRQDALFRRRGLALELSLILVLMLAGVATHALLSFVGDGMSAPRSNPWYLIVAFPWVTLLLVSGTAWLFPRIQSQLCWMAASFYFVAEVLGHAYFMTRVTTAGAGLAQSWTRLAFMGPAFLGPTVAATAFLLAGFLFVLSLRTGVGLAARDGANTRESHRQVEPELVEP